MFAYGWSNNHTESALIKSLLGPLANSYTLIQPNFIICVFPHVAYWVKFQHLSLARLHGFSLTLPSFSVVPKLRPQRDHHWNPVKSRMQKQGLFCAHIVQLAGSSKPSLMTQCSDESSRSTFGVEIHRQKNASQVYLGSRELVLLSTGKGLLLYTLFLL